VETNTLEKDMGSLTVRTSDVEALLIAELDKANYKKQLEARSKKMETAQSKQLADFELRLQAQEEAFEKQLLKMVAAA
jgi:hypothetical protein